MTLLCYQSAFSAEFINRDFIQLLQLSIFCVWLWMSNNTDLTRQMESHPFVLPLIGWLLLVRLVTAAAQNPRLCDSSTKIHQNTSSYCFPSLLNSICRKFLPLFNEVTISFNPNSSKTPPEHIWRMALSSSLHICSALHTFLRLSDTPSSVKLVPMPILSTLLNFCFLLQIVLSASCTKGRISHGFENIQYNG